MNTSTSFNITNEKSLGWQAMSAFPVENVGIELGWDAMSAFGTAIADHGTAERVADFIAESRSMRSMTKANVLFNFWNAVCR
ncbi:MAG: hypothetical protein ABL974_23920, partial [Prosthecobacter sp.]